MGKRDMKSSRPRKSPDARINYQWETLNEIHVIKYLKDLVEKNMQHEWAWILAEAWILH